MSEYVENNKNNNANGIPPQQEHFDFRANLNQWSNIKKVIGIVSGKGGVGKSSVSAMLAVTMQRLGYKVGILDADITGPSIPKAFGIKEKAKGMEFGILPAKSKTGIDIKIGRASCRERV